MLLVTDYDSIIGLERYLIVLGSLFFTAIAVSISLITLKHSLKAKQTPSHSYFLGVSTFFFFFGLYRVIFLYHDFFAPDSQDLLFWKLGNVMTNLGLVCINYIIETKIYKRTRGFSTIYGFFILISYLISTDKDIATIILYAGYAPLFILPALVYFFITRDARGELKKRSFLTLLGILIMIGGTVLSLFEIGGVLSKAYSLIISIYLSMVGLIICGYALVRIARPIDEEKVSASKDDTITLIDKLGLDFTRPKDLTNEEVAFFREQIVCLVCKTQLSGFVGVFFCPECKALYCNRCASALSQLENCCWSCESRIDETRPIEAISRETAIIVDKKKYKKEK
ncbi:MAG: hypothetical protein ACFFCS_05350 [Candidatus Hodarchaeota archaeon]